MRRQFIFTTKSPIETWYSFDRPRKDKMLSRPWNHPVVLNSGPLNWEFSEQKSVNLCILCFDMLNRLTIIHILLEKTRGKNAGFKNRKFFDQNSRLSISPKVRFYQLCDFNFTWKFSFTRFDTLKWNHRFLV